MAKNKGWAPPLRRSLSGKPILVDGPPLPGSTEANPILMQRDLVSTPADREAARVLARRSRGHRFGGPLATPKDPPTA